MPVTLILPDSLLNQLLLFHAYLHLRSYLVFTQLSHLPFLGGGKGLWGLSPFWYLLIFVAVVPPHDCSDEEARFSLPLLLSPWHIYALNKPFLQEYPKISLSLLQIYLTVQQRYKHLVYLSFALSFPSWGLGSWGLERVHDQVQKLFPLFVSRSLPWDV